jgi:DNA polymerase-1
VAHASELKGKQKDLVTQYGEQAILSKKLATIITDVPFAFDEEQLKYAGPIVEKLKPILLDLEFKSIWPGHLTSPIRKHLEHSLREGQLSMFGQDTSTNIPGVSEKKNFSPGSVQYQTIENVNQLKT